MPLFVPFLRVFVPVTIRPLVFRLLFAPLIALVIPPLVSYTYAAAGHKAQRKHKHRNQ
jgi:hypothetical protein